MRLANVPPPMSLYEVEVRSTIIDVAITIRSNARPRAIIGILHHRGYSQFEWPLSSMAQSPPVCRLVHDFWSTITDVTTNRDRLYLQTSFSGTSNLLFSKSTDHSTLTVIGEDGKHTDQRLLRAMDADGVIKDSGLSSSIIHIVLDHDHKTDTDESERSLGFNVIDPVGIKYILSSFSTQRVDAVICNIGIDHPVNSLANGLETPDIKGAIFSLAENGSLFANERCLTRNCTSFLVTTAHLIFTTSQHLLKFVHLTKDTEGESSLT